MAAFMKGLSPNCPTPAINAAKPLKRSALGIPGLLILYACLFSNLLPAAPNADGITNWPEGIINVAPLATTHAQQGQGLPGYMLTQAPSSKQSDNHGEPRPTGMGNPQDTPGSNEDITILTTHGEVLFESPQGFWLAPSKWRGTLYGPSMHNANWHFTQWKNPGADFPPFNGDKTRSLNGRLVDRGGQWEIAQNGINLPPGDEYAVFAEANQPHVYPNHRPAGSRSQPLSRMEYLHHSIGFQSKYERVVERGGLSKGGFITAVVLENTDNGNKFYYQLELRGVNKSPGKGWWYWSGPTWGYSDTILSYGMPEPPRGQRAFYHLDLLPRLTAVLQAASNGCDPDIAHWIVIGTYHGSHIWGHLQLTSIWDSFSLHTRYKNY
jgi:hypothetical protein